MPLDRSVIDPHRRGRHTVRPEQRLDRRIQGPLLTGRVEQQLMAEEANKGLGVASPALAGQRGGALRHFLHQLSMMRPERVAHLGHCSSLRPQSTARAALCADTQRLPGMEAADRTSKRPLSLHTKISQPSLRWNKYPRDASDTGGPFRPSGVPRFQTVERCESGEDAISRNFDFDFVNDVRHSASRRVNVRHDPLTP